MVDAGCLDDVAAIFGGHLDQHYAVGTIVVHNGCVNASTDTFTITVHGKGGHGARPHQGVDSILVGAEIVVALQTCLSREVNGADPVVLTVGRFQAGTAPNVMAGEASLAGTFRTLDPAVRAQARDIVGRVSETVAAMHGAAATVVFSDGIGPVVNTEREYAMAWDAASALVEPGGVVIPLHKPNMGAEDFAAYGEAGCPGCYVRLGTATPGVTEVPAHSSTWDLNEATLPLGARYYASLASIAGERLVAAAAAEA